MIEFRGRVYSEEGEEERLQRQVFVFFKEAFRRKQRKNLPRKKIKICLRKTCLNILQEIVSNS